MKRLVLLSFIWLLAACHPRAQLDFVADGGDVTDGSSADGPGESPNARAQAVETTITINSTCTGLPNFYWEIGDVHGPLASGQVGTLFSASTKMKIASASKWIWGAYVVERFKSDLSMIDFPSMSMQSGYTGLDYTSCVNSSTVQDCFDSGNNGKLDPAVVGHFYYNGGHFQHYAIGLGLGGDDSDALAAEMKSQLGPELDLEYASPQLAGGMQSTATAYAAFLRKILAGQLAIHDQLGAQAVCTLPSVCPSSQYSPSPLAWHYSYAHWVEDDPDGDGAFSSPGANGFYPWIDASKSYYGVLARYSLAAGAYIESADCGRLLRKAFLTATPQ